jgi:hypothetical protein
VFVLAAIAALQIFLAKQPYGTDLWAYVLAGRHLLAGDPLYPPDPVVPFGPFGEYHYAPATAVPFMLLAPLPFWLATSISIGLNVGVAAAIGVHLIRPLPRDWQPWAAAGYVLFLPTTLEITLGQLNLVTVGLCLAAWSLRRRPVLSGIVLAVAIGVKLLPATLVLYYLASGRTRVVVTTAITGLAGLLLTWIVFPHDFPAYIAILAELRGSSWAADYVASGSPATLAALVGSPIAVAALPVLALVSAIGGGVLARRDVRYETHLHHLALAFSPYVASFSLIWFTYLVTALPALATTLQWALLAPRRATRACLVSGLALSWLLLQVLGDEPEDIVPIAAHLLGLVLLFALGILVLVFTRVPERTGDSRPVAIATMR